MRSIIFSQGRDFSAGEIWQNFGIMRRIIIRLMICRLLSGAKCTNGLKRRQTPPIGGAAASLCFYEHTDIIMSIDFN